MSRTLYATPVIVQKKSGQLPQNSFNILAIAFDAPVTVGNAVALSIAFADSTGLSTIASIVDDQSNSYTVDALSPSTNVNAAGSAAAVSLLPNVTNAPETVTTTLTNTGASNYFGFATIYEISGIVASSALDVSYNTSIGYSSTQRNLGFTTDTPTEFAISTINGSDGTLNQDNGWTTDDTTLNASHVVLTSAGANAWIYHPTGGSVDSIAIATFRAALASPTITADPVTEYGAVGGTASFVVSATANSGSLTYQWYRASPTSLYSNAPGTFSSVSGATSATYTTGTLSASDNGAWFYCAVTDSLGTIDTLQVRLWIIGLSSNGKGSLLGSAWAIEHAHDESWTGAMSLAVKTGADYTSALVADQIGYQLWNRYLLGAFDNRLSTTGGALAPVTCAATSHNANTAFVSGSTVLDSGITLQVSAEGSLDWVAYDGSAQNRKVDGGTKISSPVAYAGSSLGIYGDDSRNFAWVDGDVTGGFWDTKGQYNDSGGLNNGYTFTVPADTKKRILRIYCGGYGGGGGASGPTLTLSATLSDGSAVPYIDTSNVMVTGTSNYWVYTIEYQAASASQTLTIDYFTSFIPSGNSSSNVTIAAVTLQFADTTGYLAGSGVTDSGTVDLTGEGTADWAHYISGATPTVPVRKATGGSTISNATGYPTIGGSQTDIRTFTWSDGDSPSSGSDSLYTCNNGTPAQTVTVTVPADTSPRVVRVYASGNHSGINIIAEMSDASVVGYSDDTISNTSLFACVYKFFYRAASPSQTLKISVQSDIALFGNTGIAAVTLQLAREGQLAGTLGALTLSATSTSGSTGRTAALAATLGALTLSAASTDANHAALSTTLAALTLSSTATDKNHGAVTVTLGAVTSTSASTVKQHGALTATLATLTVSAAAADQHKGTTAATLAALTLSAAATNKNHGTLAFTLAAVTSSAASTNKNHGTAAVTLGAVTSSSAGTNKLHGTLSATLSAATLSATGVDNHTGTLSKTLAALTSVSASTNKNHGTATVTLGAVTSSAASTLKSHGTLAVTLGALTLSAASADKNHAALAVTLGAVTASAAGADRHYGVVSLTLGAVACSAASTNKNHGALSGTLAAVTSTSAGTNKLHGTLTATLGTLTSSATGADTHGGVLAVTLAALTSSSASTNKNHGALTGTLAAVTIAATGMGSGNAGNLSVTLGAVTCSAASTNKNHGAVAVTLDALTSSSASTVKQHGALTVTLAAVTVSSAASIGQVGAVNATLAALTTVSASTLKTHGSLSSTLASLTVSAAATDKNHGALTVTLDDVSISATGGSGADNGALNVTLDALTSSSAATVKQHGALSVTLGALTSSGAGITSTRGSLAVTLGAVAVSAAGTDKNHGAVALTLGALTSSSASTLKSHGALSVTLGAATLSASSTAGNGAHVIVTLGAVTCSAASTNKNHGALSKTLASLSSSSATTLKNHGALAVTLGALDSLSAAANKIRAALSATLGTLTASAAGTGKPTGAVVQTLAALSAVCAATVRISASLAKALGALTSVSASTNKNHGAATVTLGSLTCSAQLVSFNRAALTATLAAVSTSSASTVRVSATSHVTLGAVTCVASSSDKNHANLNDSLAPAIMSAHGSLKVSGTVIKVLADLSLNAYLARPIDGDVLITLQALAVNATGHLTVIHGFEPSPPYRTITLHGQSRESTARKGGSRGVTVRSSYRGRRA